MNEQADQPGGDENEGTGNRGALLAVAVLVVLIGAGLWLTHVLGGAASLQDCVAAGRTNCAPVHTQN
jgi:hypothetical protein